jgi:hypothetical protein
MPYLVLPIRAGPTANFGLTPVRNRVYCTSSQESSGKSEAPYKGLFLTSSGHDHHEDVKGKEWNGDGKSKKEKTGNIPISP